MSRFDEERLDALFRAYRDAFPDPEPSPGFMPGLWEKIEARRRYSWSLRRWAGGFVTAAAAVCMLMAVFLVWPVSSNQSVYTSTYIEALGDDMVMAYLVDGPDDAAEGVGR